MGTRSRAFFEELLKGKIMTEETAPLQGDGIKAEALSKVWPMTAKIDDSDIHEKHLYVGGVNVAKLPRITTSPLYIMDEEDIRTRFREYRHGMSEAFDEYRVSYAAKAFFCKAMSHIVEEEDCNLLVCSGGELAIAEAAGYPMDKVVFHGNNKSEDEIAMALMDGVGTIVIDNMEEIGKLDINADMFDAEPNVMLRLKTGIHADTHDYLQTSREDSKFGLSIASGEAMEGVRAILDSDHLHLTGFMAHIGSQIFNIEPYDREIEILIDFACKVRDELGYTAAEIDLGGGLGIAYTKDDEPTSIADYTAHIGEKMHSYCEQAGFPMPLVAIEPGRSVVGNAGITCYRAGAPKKIDGVRTYVPVDGGMSDNIRPALYGAKYEAIVAERGSSPRSEVYTIVGKHCESGDVLIEDASLQPVEDGETICIFATGAYCYSMSSNYNSVPRPGVTFVKDGKYRPVVRPQTYDDLLACDLED